MNISNNLSSIQAQQSALNTSANNVVNVNSDGFVPSQTTITNSSENSVSATTSQADDNGSSLSQTDISKEITDQIILSRGVEANVASIKTQDQLTGALLDIKA